MNKQPTHILMCSPDHFSVTYVINPWMKVGSVDPIKAKKQWKKLADAYASLGVRVDIIAQEKKYPDMVFATDQGLVKEGNVLLSRFHHQERQGETWAYRQWFEKNKFTIRDVIFDAFEAGDCLEYNEICFLGTGFRASKRSKSQIANFLRKEVVFLELVDEKFYHLDTCLFPLDEKTVFYFAPAFSPNALTLLRERVAQLIEIEEKEALNFCANSVRVGNQVLTQVGNPTFAGKLKELGYVPLELDLSEFQKAGGGIHCLTLVLS